MMSLFLTCRSASMEDITAAIKKAAAGPMKGILSFTDHEVEAFKCTRALFEPFLRWCPRISSPAPTPPSSSLVAMSFSLKLLGQERLHCVERQVREARLLVCLGL